MPQITFDNKSTYIGYGLGLRAMLTKFFDIIQGFYSSEQIKSKTFLRHF